MSAKYTFLAWDTPIDNAPLKLALLQLANNADDDGFSYYSISKMALACGMSERSFMRKIQELEKMDVLTVERRSNRPSLYTLIGDEMGVTLCHLQSAEVTESHAEVTESHLVGDRESHDLNSTPKTTTDKEASPALNYQAIEDCYHKFLPKAPLIAKMTDPRKRLVKKFFLDFDMNMEKLESYFSFLSSEQSFDWLFQTRPRNDGTNSRWQKKKLEYFFSEKCYLDAKELDQDD